MVDSRVILGCLPCNKYLEGHLPFSVQLNGFAKCDILAYHITWNISDPSSALLKENNDSFDINFSSTRFHRHETGYLKASLHTDKSTSGTRSFELVAEQVCRPC